MVYSDYLMHYGVLGMKRGIRRAKTYASKSKSLRKTDPEKSKEYAAKAKAIENKHKSRVGTKAYNRVDKAKTSVLVGQSLCMGTYGALNYHRAKASDMSTGKSIVAGICSNVLNNLLIAPGLVSVVEPRLAAYERTNRKW